MWPFIKKTPLRRQNDPIECGSVSLGIILEHYGCYVSNADLRKACQTSRNGSDAHAIIEGAKRYFLSGTAKRITPFEIKHSSTPSILFFDQGHFVIFEGYFLGRYFINDPALGRYTLQRDELKKRFSDIIISFKRDDNFSCEKLPRSYFSKDIQARLIFVLLGIFCGFIQAVAGSFIGRLLTSKEIETSIYVNFFIGIVLLLSTLFMVLFWNSIKHISYANFQNEAAAYKSGVLNVAYSFFEDFPFYIFKNGFSDSFKNSFSYWKTVGHNYFFSSFIITLGAFSSLISVWMLLLYLLFLIAFFIQYVFFWHQPSYKSALSSPALPFLPLDLRMMGQSALLLEELIKKEIKESARIKDTILVSKNYASVLFIIAFFMLVPHLWTIGALTLAEAFSLAIATYFSYLALRMLKLEAPKKDKNVLILSELQAQSKTFITKSEKANHKLVEFIDLSFSYSGETQPVFHNLNLVIEENKLIGVVGEDSCGKSTLLKLLGAKILPKSGRIIHYCKNNAFFPIASIDDDADLMEANLKDTITLFDPHSKEEAIVQALTESFALDIFFNRPMGLLMPIANHGKNLSASEKKRLLLAQALFHKPALILLDDFFSYLDQEQAERILKSLLQQNITTVFTSFQEAELRLSHEVIFIENKGSLIVDSHHNLLASNESYRQLLMQRIE